MSGQPGEPRGGRPARPGRPRAGGPGGRPDGGSRRVPLHVREMRSEEDVFATRLLARDAAAALGLDTQDQVRLATALSEVARDTLRVGGARIAFDLDPSGAFTVSLTTARPLPDQPAEAPGLAAARRLVDRVELITLPESRSLIRLTRNLSQVAGPDQVRRSRVRQALESATAHSPLEELRAQNSDLLLALEELQAKQQELIGLNAELEETNKGVLALYGELSAELEETNRGVVALYAELDERGAQLQQANEAKNRFLRSVSHELRTPVNSIIGLARLLLDPDVELAGEQRRQVELIGGSARDLLGRINQLLDVAKAESGRIEPVWTDVDLRPVFAGLRGRLRPLVAEGVTLVIDGPPATGPGAVATVRTDEGLLRDILHNLLGNAAKFTERGEIRMSAEVAPGGDRLLISVVDTGIGIAPQDCERIFDEFFQVPGPAQARLKGTGLGLPYARRVATILGGGLSVASELGVGSTFTVWLPYQPDRPAPPARTDLSAQPEQSESAAPPEPAKPLEPSEPAALPEPSEQPEPVTPEPAAVSVALVVEDDPAYRAVLRGLLRPYAEQVVEAHDVPQALAVLRETVPSVILLDLGLPGTSGTALLTAITQEPRLHPVPVVVVTAADLSTPGLGTELGAAAAVVSKSDLNGPLLGHVLSRVVRAR